MSKGSTKRPMQVPKKQFEDAWDKIFKKGKKND